MPYPLFTVYLCDTRHPLYIASEFGKRNEFIWESSYQETALGKFPKLNEINASRSLHSETLGLEACQGGLTKWKLFWGAVRQKWAVYLGWGSGGCDVGHGRADFGRRLSATGHRLAILDCLNRKTGRRDA